MKRLRIKNLKLLKIYNESLAKWIKIYRITNNSIERNEITLTSIDDTKELALTSCSFCRDKDNRQMNQRSLDIKNGILEKKYITIKCYCPISICHFCKDDLDCMINEINDCYDIYVLFEIIKQLIVNLNHFKTINCFK